MNGKTAFVLLSGVLSGSLGACVQPPDAAAPARTAAAPGSGSGTGACASPGSRAAARRPVGQHPGGDVRKAAGVVTRRSGRGIAVLYRLSGRALR
jgi:hypothetical protein